MINAVSVLATDDFFIIVKLADSRSIKLNMSFIHNESGSIVTPIQKIEEFKKVFIQNGIVTWPSGYDIDPYFLINNASPFTKTA